MSGLFLYASLFSMILVPQTIDVYWPELQFLSSSPMIFSKALLAPLHFGSHLPPGFTISLLI